MKRHVAVRLGLLGFLSLDEVWQEDIAPEIEPNVSAAAFEVIDDTVTKVLGSRELFWVTIGAAIATWEIAGVESWAVGLALMVVVVALLVHHAPDISRPLHRVSFGALPVVVGWAVMSLGFYLYITTIADYDSLFASLATIIVTMTYLYASVIVFLTGVQLDALVSDGFEERAPGTA